VQLGRGGLWNCTIVFGILETKIYSMQMQLMIHFLGARAYLSQCLQKVGLGLEISFFGTAGIIYDRLTSMRARSM
jgi:hypothetical protein